MLDEAVNNQQLTLHQISDMSGVPYSVVYDIAHGKKKLENCAYQTVHKLAKALQVSSDDLVQTDTFEHFRDELHAQLKSAGPKEFMLHYIQSNAVVNLYRAGYTSRAMYLMCMIDYLSRLMGVPLMTRYSFLRNKKLYPPLIIADHAIQNPQYIPEFADHGILEGDILDAV